MTTISLHTEFNNNLLNWAIKHLFQLTCLKLWKLSHKKSKIIAAPTLNLSALTTFLEIFLAQKLAKKLEFFTKTSKLNTNLFMSQLLVTRNQNYFPKKYSSKLFFFFFLHQNYHFFIFFLHFY